MLIKFSYPYIFGILVRRSGKPAMSSSDICVCRIEGVKCLFGKDVVPKHGPLAPVIHGTLHFGIHNGERVCILCRRIIRRLPRVRVRLDVRPWSPTGGGVIGNLSGYSLASVFPTRKRGRYYILKDDNHGAGFCIIPLRRRLSPDRLPFWPTRLRCPLLASRCGFGTASRRPSL